VVSTIRACEIVDNYAGRLGGGVAIIDGARAIIENTRIEGSSAWLSGGGIATEGEDASVEIYRCEIVENEAFEGGGINGIVTRADSCEILRNTAYGYEGGGFYGGEIWATDCRFEGNYSNYWVGRSASTIATLPPSSRTV